MQSIADLLGHETDPLAIVELGKHDPEVLVAWIQEELGIDGPPDRHWVESIHRGAQNSTGLYVDPEFSLGLQLQRFPVDIETFLFDSYYLAKERREIYPAVLDELKAINNPQGLRIVNPYTEGVFTGGIGSAKTTTALYTNAYQLYVLSCFQDPHGAFNLDRSSEILFAFLAVAGNAAEADYGRFYAMLEHSPYFNIDFPYNKRVKTMMEFPHRIQVVSQINTIGQNVMGGMIDEVNFGQLVKNSKRSLDGGEWDQALSVYNGLARRRKSRFLMSGRMPGILCLVSSKRYPGEFTDKKLEEAKTDPSIYVYDKRVWDIKPPNSYCGEWFYVFPGSSRARPSIVHNRNDYTEQEQEQFVRVPVEYKRDFQDDLPGALRDIAGVGTIVSYPYFQNVNAVADAFKHGPSILNLEQTDMETQPLEFFPKRFKNLNRKRWVHVDLGLVSDHCGIACGYVEEFKLTEEEICLMPVITFDFILRVAPPPNGEIKFFKIRRLLTLLRDSGLPIEWVSFDAFQSTDSMQLLRQAGFKTGRQVVDLNASFYSVAKTAVYAGRVKAPKHTKCQEELLRLERNMKTGKVDHPPNGSKDCSDAFAGVIYGLTMRREIWLEHGVPFNQMYQSVKEVEVTPEKGEDARYIHKRK